MSIDLDGVFFGSRAVLPPRIRLGAGRRLEAELLQRGKRRRGQSDKIAGARYGRDGVRINAACPTLTRTDLTADMFKDEVTLDIFRERIALGRMAEPEDTAGAIAVLATDDDRFITGVNPPGSAGQFNDASRGFGHALKCWGRVRVPT
ncbi:SDR family oxidoreductase [Cupriavidus sp. YR651]|uniref:SDR family oxidoreductase n=1 Tax=Cupriavidus sp. YR651 TaxID=1855315 RepID=UPI002100D18E|nr:SDR family oxidoreductase [Cupriavidus sp. YR651]